MIVVWSPRAIRHLTHLWAHIARDNPQAANAIAVALLDAVERLTKLPTLADQVVSPAHVNSSFLAPDTSSLIGFGISAWRSWRSSAGARSGRKRSDIPENGANGFPRWS